MLSVAILGLQNMQSAAADLYDSIPWSIPYASIDAHVFGEGDMIGICVWVYTVDLTVNCKSHDMSLQKGFKL